MAGDETSSGSLGSRRARELVTDGRVSYAELGRRVKLSPSAVAERVQRLERGGVITGYRPRSIPAPLASS
jgi:Lrp/AsnC family leucine-responsive transcriptional regulator